MRLDSAVRSSRRPWVGQPPSTSTELAPPRVALSHRPGDRGRSQSNQIRPTTAITSDTKMRQVSLDCIDRGSKVSLTWQGDDSADGGDGPSSAGDEPPLQPRANEPPLGDRPLTVGQLIGLLREMDDWRPVWASYEAGCAEGNVASVHLDPDWAWSWWWSVDSRSPLSHGGVPWTS